ncbi:MAG: tetratricopeptide repeat protein [Armatimonadetes bacterium]|nr:tetratricopeptide repeat protein [Armatimonadota bacterium]
MKLDLPEASVKAEDVEELLKDGYRLIHEHKVDEALFVASSILAAFPDEAGAHVLRGMCFEHKGDMVSAIAAYGEVARLRPESTLDQIKLNQLRRSTEVPSEAPADQRRSMVAILCALGAAAVVSGVGIMFALPPDAERRQKETLLTDNTYQASGFELPSQEPQPKRTLPANTPAGASSELPAARSNASGQRPVIPNAMRSVAPLSVPLEIVPANEGSLSAAGRSEPNTAPTAPASAGPKPRPKPKSVGRIEIAESGPANPSEPAVSENTYRVAQNKMASGDYRGAIRDFTASLAGSGRPALIHQFIGRCYARVGETGSARQHFQSALSMYEKSGAENEAKACRRELDLLG